MAEQRKKSRPAPIADSVSTYLKKSGLERRVDDAGAVTAWPRLVGKQIAAVTEPLYVTSDGTLLVAVKTNAWMSELSLLEPEILRSLNSRKERKVVKKIRFRLKR